MWYSQHVDDLLIVIPGRTSTVAESTSESPLASVTFKWKV